MATDMSKREIKDQVRLGPSVAFEVVLQGIRIRIGRSVITLLGVTLGIAFLMSMLSSEVIRSGVGQEDSLRAEASRMHSFLMAESGPVRGRTVAVLQVGALEPREVRFIEKLLAERVERLNWAGEGALPESLAKQPRIRRVAPEQAFENAMAAIIIGMAPAGVRFGMADGYKGVIAYTRRNDVAQLGVGRDMVVLDREFRPEELDRIARDLRRSQFRSVWIIVISLLVTVIGISNAMLMSVTERFREIGTMKCLGALSSFIRQIFLIESSLIGLIGSIAGVLIGFGFSCGAYVLTYGWSLVSNALKPGMMLGYAGVAVVAGIALSMVAAIYPARIASRMVPADALRTNI